MTAPLAPRPLPVRTPRPPLVLGPVSSFLVTFVPTALVRGPMLRGRFRDRRTLEVRLEGLAS